MTGGSPRHGYLLPYSDHVCGSDGASYDQDDGHILHASASVEENSRNHRVDDDPEKVRSVKVGETSSLADRER